VNYTNLIYKYTTLYLFKVSNFVITFISWPSYPERTVPKITADEGECCFSVALLVFEIQTSGIHAIKPDRTYLNSYIDKIHAQFSSILVTWLYSTFTNKLLM
jgi:hypothetical protein